MRGRTEVAVRAAEFRNMRHYQTSAGTVCNHRPFPVLFLKLYFLLFAISLSMLSSIRVISEPDACIRRRFMSSSTLRSVTWAYICVVVMLLCPIIRLTVSIGTPIDRVICVPKLCLALWNIHGKASNSEQV